MESIRTALLKAAFAGSDADLLQTLQTLQQHHQKHNSLHDRKNETSAFVIQCIEYSSKHSNTAIATISSQILAAANLLQTPVKNGNANHTNGDPQSSAMSARSVAATPPQTPANASSVVGAATKKKKKASFTQRTVSSIEERLSQCLQSNTKLNESIISELIDFLYKSLESCRIKKSFEKIVFKSVYICTVLSALHQIMAHSLLDLDLFDQKNDRLHNLSLHDIIEDVIHKNISISGDESNAEIYKQNINNIKAEISKISDQPHIHKLTHIQQQIEECLRDGTDTENSVGKIEEILVSLHRDCITTKQIKVNKNVLDRAKGIYGCVQNLQCIRKKSIIKHSKMLISAWDVILNPKPASMSSNNAKQPSLVNLDKHSGKKRRHRDIDSASTSKTHERDYSVKKRRKTKGSAIPTATSKKRTKISSVKCTKSKIRDTNTESESEEDETQKQRRSPRNAARKLKTTKKKDVVCIGSDLYGGESEEESLSEDDEDEEIQKKEEELFLMKKERNRKRIESEQQHHIIPDAPETAATRQLKSSRSERESGVDSGNAPRNVKSMQSLKESRNRGSGKTKIVMNVNMKKSKEMMHKYNKNNESGNESPDFELSDDDTPPKVVRRSSVKQSGATKILQKFVSGYQRKGNIKTYLMGMRGMPNDQLSIIRNDSRLSEYLREIQHSQHYDEQHKQLAIDILNKL